MLALEIIGNKLQQSFTDWLYGEYSEDKLFQFEMLYHIPLVKNYMDFQLDLRADREYMNRYQISYSDIHDPRKLRSVSSGSSFYGSAYQMISRNLDKLYR